MKGSIAALYTYFSSGVIEGVDIGTAYVGLYSNIIYLFSLFLLLVSIVSSLFFFKNQIQKKEYKTNIIIYSLIYSIFTFSILKNTIDGGILNTEAIPFIFGLYLLVSNSYLKINKNIFIGVTGFTLIIIFLQNVLVTLNIAVLSVISIPHLTGVLSLMILLLYIHFLRSSQEKRSYIKSNYFFALILIISVCGFYYSTKDSLDTISYKNTELSAGDQVFVFSRKDIAEPGLLESYRIGDMRFYKGRIESNASVGSLVKKTAAPLNFEPVSVVGQACQIYGRPKKLYFNLVDLSDTTNKLNIQTFKEDNNEFFTIDSIDIISNNTNQMHNEYSVSASVHPCVGREVEIIQQMFVTHGLKSFVIFNISFN